MEQTSGNIEFSLLLTAELSPVIKVIFERAIDPETAYPFCVRTIYNDNRLSGTYVKTYAEGIKLYAERIAREFKTVLR